MMGPIRTWLEKLMVTRRIMGHATLEETANMLDRLDAVRAGLDSVDAQAGRPERPIDKPPAFAVAGPNKIQ